MAADVRPRAMTSADVIIVGSGAAGTFAAFQLRGRRVLVLDVGHRADESGLGGNLFDLRRNAGIDRAALFRDLIGPSFESLHNIFHPYLSPKLKAPRMRFVTRDATTLSPVVGHNFDAVMSFAVGGLANAWGAGLYRFTAPDLSEFPIDVADLEPYYNAITDKIGISGADDDLSRFFGSARGLQPPVEIDSNGRALLQRYARRREALNRRGLYIGRPRLAVLTRDHDGRSAYRYEALEFFRPNNPAVYTPAYTLDEMIRRGDITYHGGLLVEHYIETDVGITVMAREGASGEARAFACRRLILAAGALNTAKIVLASYHDHAATLPLLDNNVSYVPLLDPWRIGAPLEKRIYPAAMLNSVGAGEGWPSTIQMTLYGVAGTLRSDYLFDFPLSARGNVAAAKYLTPALVLVQVFYPDAPAATNSIRLSPGGQLELRYEAKARGAVEARLLKLFRTLGYLGSIRLCRYLAPGNSFHYAGALPMKAEPTDRYQTDRTGRLSGTRGVYVADAANFSALPSKNHTFTMMANAMRIAEQAGRSLG
jgi:choline dehydrogenase-like flavoprotein